MAAFDFMDTTKRNIEQYLFPSQGAVNEPNLTGLSAMGGIPQTQQPPQLPAMAQPQQEQNPLMAAAQQTPQQQSGGIGNDEQSLTEILRLGTISYLQNMIKQLKGGEQSGQSQG